MQTFCLVKEKVDAFKKALISGEINPELMAKMSTQERNQLLGKFVGEDTAKSVNTLFESKLLLKNQQQGFITWANKTLEGKSVIRKDIIDKINGMTEILSPEDSKAFLGDLVEQRLGVAVTKEEAATLVKFSQAVQQTQVVANDTLEQSLTKGGNYKMSQANLNWGRAQADMILYMSDLKNDVTKFRWSDFTNWKSGIKLGPKLLKGVVDASKAVGASLDDSFVFRQGKNSFWTNNTLWRRETLKSFKSLVGGAKNIKTARREFMANLMGDPAYKQAIKDGLALGKRDDVFPTSAPGRVPVAGRLFNASEIAYDTMAQDLRMGIYKKYMGEAFTKIGDVLPKDYGKNMATMVNSLTGRGSLGRMEGASGTLNLAFYSARFIKSNIDVLVLHPLGVGVHGAAQKAAIINLGKILAGTASVLMTANALMPGSAELDPRSSNFGKIKIGDSRFDVTGGMAQYLTLASRMITSSSKSSTTGLVSKLNSSDYGSSTTWDIVLNFFANKLSPVGGVIRDRLKGQNFDGSKVSVMGDITKTFTPMAIGNAMEASQNPNGANPVANYLADFFGISANTYSASGGTPGTSSWETSNNADRVAFKAKVGDTKFKEAGLKFDEQYNTWMTNLIQKPEYKALPDMDKLSLISSKKNQLETNIFKEYGFKYKAPKTNKVKLDNLLK